MTNEAPQDWNNLDHRIEALHAFITMLNDPKNERLRERCKRSPKLARKEFIKCGHFSTKASAGQTGGPAPVPAEVEFRVYEEERAAETAAKRNELVTIVLPEDPQYDPETVWACTYIPYATIRLRTRRGSATGRQPKESKKAPRKSARARST